MRPLENRPDSKFCVGSTHHLVLDLLIVGNLYIFPKLLHKASTVTHTPNIQFYTVARWDIGVGPCASYRLDRRELNLP